MKFSTFLFMVASAGCFNPDLSTADLLCDGVSRFCPDGYSCAEGHCREGQSESGDMVSVSNDGPLPIDMSIAKTGCSDGKGTDLSTGASVSAFACLGTFEASSDPNKSAVRLCAPGYKVCVQSTGINQTQCGSLFAFYLADVSARAMLPSAFGCGSARSGETPGFAGCGAGAGSVVIAACGGFGRAVFAVGGNGLSVSPPFGPIDTTAQNTSSTVGVICCK